MCIIQEKLQLLSRKLKNIGDCYFSSLIDDSFADKNSLDSFLVSNELWGGSGSIADQAGFIGEIRLNERREIESLLIDIGEEQMRQGKTNMRTSHWVSTFKDWVENDI